MANIFSQNPAFILIILLWVLPWKGYAMWKAARLNEKWWYVALLIVNTFGLLEILYIFYFSKKEFRDKLKKIFKRA